MNLGRLRNSAMVYGVKGSRCRCEKVYTFERSFWMEIKALAAMVVDLPKQLLPERWKISYWCGNPI